MFDFKNLPEIIAELDAIEEREKIKKMLPILARVIGKKLNESECQSAKTLATIFQSSFGGAMLCAMLKHMPTQGDERLEKFVAVMNDPQLALDLTTEAILTPVSIEL